MAKFLSTPINISPGALSAWTDVDLTANVGADAGNVGAAIILIENTSGTAYAGQLRANGSTDNRVTVVKVRGTSSHVRIVGVDNNDVFEAYKENAAVVFHLLGWFLKTEAKYLVNAIDKTPVTTSAWVDVSFAADTGADTAKAVCIEITSYAVGQFRGWGLRANGSTDDRRRNTPGEATTGGMIGVDVNEIAEFYNGVLGFWFSVYIIASYISFTNGLDRSNTVTAAFQTKNLSADTPASAVAALIHIHPFDDTENSWSARETGQIWDVYRAARKHVFAPVKFDASRQIDVKVSAATMDTFLQGYFTASVIPDVTVANVQQSANQSAVIGSYVSAGNKLVVAAMYEDTSVVRAVSGITFGVRAMIKVGEINYQVGSVNGISVWYLDNPTGTDDISAVWVSNPIANYKLYALCLTNAGAGPPHEVVTAGTQVSPINSLITTEADKAMILAFAVFGEDGAIGITQAGSGQVLDSEQESGTGGWGAAVSHLLTSLEGNYSIGYTHAAPNRLAQVVLAFSDSALNILPAGKASTNAFGIPTVAGGSPPVQTISVPGFALVTKYGTSTVIGGAPFGDFQTYREEVLVDQPGLFLGLGDGPPGTVATDQSGNNRHGVYQSGFDRQEPSLTGEPGNLCVLMAGASGRISVPDTLMDWMNGLSEFTIDLLIKPTAAQLDGSNRALVSRRVDVNNNHQFDLYMFAGFLRGRAAAPSQGWAEVSHTGMVANQTYYIAMRYKQGEIEVQWRNVLSPTVVNSGKFTATVTTLPAVNSDLHIARGHSGDTFGFDGYIDEVAIYPNWLTDEQLFAHALNVPSPGTELLTPRLVNPSITTIDVAVGQPIDFPAHGLFAVPGEERNPLDYELASIYKTGNRTNKLTSHNLKVTEALRPSLGTKGGSSLGVWSIINRSTEPLLQHLLVQGWNGNVHRLDNSNPASTVESYIVSSAKTGTTNPIGLSLWARRVAGSSAEAKLEFQGGPTAGVEITGNWQRRFHFASVGSNVGWAVSTGPGDIIEFVAEEMFEGSDQHNEVIEVQGVAASKTVTFPATSDVVFDPETRKVRVTAPAASNYLIQIRAIDEDLLSTVSAFSLAVGGGTGGPPPPLPVNAVWADFAVGSDTSGQGTEALPFKTIERAARQAKLEGKPVYVKGNHWYTATQTFDVAHADVEILGYNSPIVSFGTDISGTNEQMVGQLWWAQTVGTEKRLPLLEVSPQSGPPRVLDVVHFRPVGCKTSQWPTVHVDVRERRSGWIRLSNSSGHYVGRLPQVVHDQVQGIVPVDGQVYGVYGLATVNEYYKYGHPLIGLTDPNIITFDSNQNEMLSGQLGTINRGIEVDGCLRLFNFAPWLNDTDNPTETYAYAPNCGTVNFDGQTVAFPSLASPVKVTASSGGTGWLMAVQDDGTTGKLFLAHCTGTFSDNATLQIGGVTHALQNGAFVSKGNRVIIKSGVSLTGARIVQPAPRTIGIGFNITAGAAGMTWGSRLNPIHYRNMAERRQVGNTTGENEMFRILANGVKIIGNEFLGNGIGVKIQPGVANCIVDDNGFKDFGAHAIWNLANGSSITHNACIDQRGAYYSLVEGTAIADFSQSDTMTLYNMIVRCRVEAIHGSTNIARKKVNYNFMFDCQHFADDSGCGIYLRGTLTDVECNYNVIQFGHGFGKNKGDASWPITVAKGSVQGYYLDDLGICARSKVIGNVTISYGDKRIGSCPIFLHTNNTVSDVSREIDLRGNVLFHQNDIGAGNSHIGNQANDGMTMTDIDISGNVLVQIGTWGAYLEHPSSGTRSYTIMDYNACKKMTNAGSMGVRPHDVYNPAWMTSEGLLVGENPNEEYFGGPGFNPTLKTGTAQQLKQARGTGIGIGFVDLPWTDMKTAGRRSAPTPPPVEPPPVEPPPVIPPVNPTAYVLADARTGSDTTGNGQSIPYATIRKAAEQAKLLNKPVLASGPFDLAATDVYSSAYSGVKIRGNPNDIPRISGGYVQSSSLERSVVGSRYWSFLAPSNGKRRFHMVEMTRPGVGAPFGLREVFWRPAGSRALDYPGEADAENKSGWIGLNVNGLVAGNLRHKNYRMNTSLRSQLSAQIPVNTGQVWVKQASNPVGPTSPGIQYFWYNREVTSLPGTDQISCADQFSGPQSQDRAVNGASRMRIHNYPLWLQEADCPINYYSYAHACWKLLFTGASTFVDGELVTQDVTGAQGRVMSSTTGEVFLVQGNGVNFTVNNPVRSGTTLRATPTSVLNKGNRIFVKASSTENLAGSRCVVGNLNRVVEINTQMTWGADGFPIEVGGAIHSSGFGAGTDNTIGAAIYIGTGGTGTIIDSCKVSMAGVGIDINAPNCVVVNSEISHCDLSFVNLNSDGIDVADCYIHDSRGPNGQEGTGYGLRIGSTCDNNLLTDCVLDQVVQSPIQVGGQTAGTIIQFCTIYRGTNNSNDVNNGIYVINRHTTNCTIRYNYLQPGGGLQHEPTTGYDIIWNTNSDTRSLYFDDGCRNVTAHGNTVVWFLKPGKASGRAQCMLGHARPANEAEYKSPAGNNHVWGNVFVIINNGWMNRNHQLEGQADRFDTNNDGDDTDPGETGVVEMLDVHSNILINYGTDNATGYYKKEGAGPVTFTRHSYNVSIGNGPTSGSHAATNNIVDPPYQVLRVQVPGNNNELMVVDPRLHSNASAQALKLAMGAGGIGYVDPDFVRMRAAPVKWGLLAA